jgi:GTPase SAR1 family protein
MYGQIIIGAPGAGKSTYTKGMLEFMSLLPNRKRVVAVNLDPQNDNLPYDCAIDIMDLITVKDVMAEYQLGPNGALMYCMEFIYKNRSYLKEQLEKYDDAYFLFDCPGQIELFMMRNGFSMLLEYLSTELKIRLCCVQLMDASLLNDPHRFLSFSLVSLVSMINLEMPHLNVLSKYDLVKEEVISDLDELQYALAHSDQTKFNTLNERLIELVQDFGLVSYMKLAVEDKEMMFALLCEIDKANGYVFGAGAQSNESILEVAVKID